MSSVTIDIQLNIRQIRVQKFGDTRNSNVEPNVDCLVRHWMLSWMLIVELDI